MVITGQQVQKAEVVTDTKVMRGMGTQPDLPTSKTTDWRVSSSKPGTKIYNAAVAAKTAQVHPVRNDGALNPALSERH